MDITLSKEADTSKLEEETRKVLEDNSLVVKKNGVFNTSVRIVSTKEITNDGYNKFKEQVLNLNNGNKVNVGYSTDNNIWRYIYFSLNGKEIVMLNHTLDKVEADECLEMVKTFDISKKGNLNDELTLSLKEGSLSDNGAVFVLKNNSVSVYTYDVEYDVEVRTDNGWKKIEDSRNKVWTKELYTIDPNKTNNIAIDFSEFKDKMVSNKVYRVVKRFVQNGDTNKEITVSAEFQMR